MSIRISLVGVAKNSQVQRSLDQADLILLSSHRKLRVVGGSNLKTILAGISGLLDGDVGRTKVL